MTFFSAHSNKPDKGVNKLTTSGKKQVSLHSPDDRRRNVG